MVVPQPGPPPAARPADTRVVQPVGFQLAELLIQVVPPTGAQGVPPAGAQVVPPAGAQVVQHTDTQGVQPVDAPWRPAGLSRQPATGTNPNV